MVATRAADRGFLTAKTMIQPSANLPAVMNRRLHGPAAVTIDLPFEGVDWEGHSIII